MTQYEGVAAHAPDDAARNGPGVADVEDAQPRGDNGALVGARKARALGLDVRRLALDLGVTAL